MHPTLELHVGMLQSSNTFNGNGACRKSTQKNSGGDCTSQRDPLPSFSVSLSRTYSEASRLLLTRNLKKAAGSRLMRRWWQGRRKRQTMVAVAIAESRRWIWAGRRDQLEPTENLFHAFDSIEEEDDAVSLLFLMFLFLISLKKKNNVFCFLFS
ncbi:hypothetical protein S83_028224 [Arachis hypogaea]